MKRATKKDVPQHRTMRVPDWGTGMLLHECYRAFITEMQALFAPYKVSVSEWHHLRSLWEGDGISQVALSRRIGIQQASSTAVLDKLAARGFIKRVRDSKDRRNSIVHLTPQGRAMIDRLIAKLKEMNSVARRGIPKLEVAVCLAVLERMTKNLTESRAHQRNGRTQRLWRFPVP